MRAPPLCKGASGGGLLLVDGSEVDDRTALGRVQLCPHRPPRPGRAGGVRAQRGRRAQALGRRKGDALRHVHPARGAQRRRFDALCADAPRVPPRPLRPRAKGDAARLRHARRAGAARRPGRPARVRRATPRARGGVAGAMGAGARRGQAERGEGRKGKGSQAIIRQREKGTYFLLTAQDIEGVDRELRKSRDATHFATDGPAPRRYDGHTTAARVRVAVFVRSEYSNALVGDGVLQPAPRSANLDSAFGGMQLFATEAWRAAPLLLTHSAQLTQPTVRLPQL
mmetsp:Transcript_46608/g.151457  ORF Transcript_46608/g.151457 Transcript_46608/m.151457 type:complete len:283 (+) Transcript_46608:567-1415(+)